MLPQPTILVGNSLNEIILAFQFTVGKFESWIRKNAQAKRLCFLENRCFGVMKNKKNEIIYGDPKKVLFLITPKHQLSENTVSLLVHFFLFNSHSLQWWTRIKFWSSAETERRYDKNFGIEEYHALSIKNQIAFLFRCIRNES